MVFGECSVVGSCTVYDGIHALCGFVSNFVMCRTMPKHVFDGVPCTAVVALVVISIFHA